MASFLRVRRAVAAGLTAVVALLVVINLASIRATGVYSLSQERDRYVAATPGTTVRRADLGDANDRIFLRLHQAPKETPEREFHSDDGRTVWGYVRPLKGSRSLPYVFAELLFAGFGLFVLWWGRDRASFWLGIACAALAPRLLALFGDVSPPAMVGAQIAADVLTYVAFYALYAMADAVARDSAANLDAWRAPLAIVRTCVIVALVVGAVADIGGMLDAVDGGPRLPALDLVAVASESIAWIVVFCLLPPIVLALVALRARGPAARTRAGVIFASTALGLSGVAWSIGSQLARNGFSFAYQPHFETSWFTLLLIPLMFVLAIRAYGVVEVRFILRRVLVFTILTLAVTAIIMGAEKLSDTLIELVFNHAPEAESASKGFAPEQLVIAFAIVLILERLQKLLEQTAERVVFRDRDRAVEELEHFAASAATLALPLEGLFDRATEVVHAALGTGGTVAYARDDAEYVVVARRGPRVWPARLPIDDPAFVTPGNDTEPLDLDAVTGNALGSDGLVYALAVGGRAVGCLAIAPRSDAQGDPYDLEETAALARVARALAGCAVAREADAATAFVRALIVEGARAAVPDPTPAPAPATGNS
jgi:hypothetical protein